MRIAVTSQNFRTVTGHAGRARRFIVFEADGLAPPTELARVDLDAAAAAAPLLDTMAVLITGGAGEGFVRHLAARGVRVVATGESDPRLAVEAFFAGRIRSAAEGCDESAHECHSHETAGHSCGCHG